MIVIRWLILCLLVAQVGCSCERVGSPPTQLYPNPGSAIVTHGAGFNFPERLGAFSRVELRNYDKAGLDLGGTYEHDSLRIRATIYVYPKAETEPRSALVEHFADVCAGVDHSHPQAARKSSASFSMELSGRRRNGYKAEWSDTDTFAGATQRLVYELSLFEYKECFVKYRITYPESERAQAAKEDEELMRAFEWPDAAAKSASGGAP